MKNKYQVVVFYEDRSSQQVMIETLEMEADDDEQIVHFAEKTVDKQFSRKKTIIRAMIISRVVKVIGDPKIFADVTGN